MRVALYSLSEGLPGTLSIMQRPRGNDWLSDEIAALQAAGVQVLVSLLTAIEETELELTDEAACCEQQGLSYYSFPIIDRDVPPFTTTTFLFIEQLYQHFAAGQHVTIHCRQGLGRAALLAACILVLAGCTAEQACTRLSTTRGYTVPETLEQRAWIDAFAQRVAEQRRSHFTS